MMLRKYLVDARDSHWCGLVNTAIGWFEVEEQVMLAQPRSLVVPMSPLQPRRPPWGRKLFLDLRLFFSLSFAKGTKYRNLH